MADKIKMTVLSSHQRDGDWVQPGDPIEVKTNPEAIRLEAAKLAKRKAELEKKASGK